MLQQLRQLDVDKAQLEDLVALQAFSKATIAEYEDLGLETPVWIEEKSRLLARTIELKAADQRDREVADLERQLEGLQTAAERRKAIEVRLGKLRRKTVTT